MASNKRFGCTRPLASVAYCIEIVAMRGAHYAAFCSSVALSGVTPDATILDNFKESSAASGTSPDSHLLSLGWGIPVILDKRLCEKPLALNVLISCFVEVSMAKGYTLLYSQSRRRCIIY